MKKSRKMMALLAAGSICCMAAAEEAKPVAPAAPAAPAPAAKVDLFAGIPDVVATYQGKSLTKADFVEAINKMAGGDAAAAGATAELISARARDFARDIILQRLLDEQMAKAEIKPSKELAVEILKNSLKQMDPQMVELIKQQAVMQGKTLDQSIEEMASNPEMQKNAAMQDYLEKKVLSW